MGVDGVDGGRVTGKFPQKRASTGGATPSRLAAAMERGEVLKLGISKVLKFGLAPVPSSPAVVEPPRRQGRQDYPPIHANGRMGANGWCFFNREKREKRERGPRVGANAREYGVSGWSKTACRLRVGLSVGLSVRSALTLCLHQHLTTPCATSEKARGTANRRVGRAVPGTPLRGVTGEPHTGWLQRKHTVPQPEGAASVPLVAVDGACN